MSDYDIQLSEVIDEVNLIEKSFMSFTSHNQLVLLSNIVSDIGLSIEALYFQCLEKFTERGILLFSWRI